MAGGIWGPLKAVAGWQLWVRLFAFFVLVSAALVTATAVIVYHVNTDYLRDPCSGWQPSPLTATPTAAAVVAVRGGSAAASEGISFGMPICVAIDKFADFDTARTNKTEPLVLFLNGQRMSKLAGRIADQGGFILYDVQRNSDDAEAWTKLIGAPPWSGRVTLSVGVGTETGAELARGPNATISFIVFDPSAMICGLLALLFAVLALLTLASNTALLRDGDANSQFSLARCQMAWWLYLVTASFIYVSLVTGDSNGIVTAGSLVLMGISGTTALASVMVEKIPPAAGAAAPPAPPAVGGVAVPTSPASKGFWVDIASDAATPTLHRIQIIVWTLILGVVFVWKVYAGFRMPDFDPNLLIMMGISGGFYIGFKAAEK